MEYEEPKDDGRLVQVGGPFILKVVDVGGLNDSFICKFFLTMMEWQTKWFPLTVSVKVSVKATVISCRQEVIAIKKNEELKELLLIQLPLKFCANPFPIYCWF